MNANDIFRLIFKEIGGQQSDKMLSKLEHDVDVAFVQYEQAEQAEDRAQGYVNRVSTFGFFFKETEKSFV